MSDAKNEFYANPAFGGSFFKFEQDGDTVRGNIVEVSMKHFDANVEKGYAESDSPVYHLEQTDGTVLEVTASYADLKSQLRRMQPWIGDHLAIKRNRKIGTKVLFDVSVSAGRPVAKQTDEAPF